MNKYYVIVTLITATITLPLGWILGRNINLDFSSSPSQLISPFVDQIKEKPLPLLNYSINNLASYDFKPSSISTKKKIDETADYNSYLFSYQTLGKTMTGQLNVPTSPPPTEGYPVVILIRGWVPKETYSPGTGTKAAAAIFAQNGYITLAPDFFGFGESDAESTDSWEARFQKPINIIELLKTIEDNPLIKIDQKTIKLSSQPKSHYIWAHSNGGQIALSVLEILDRPITTTLWAPVTAPFPYSILFFSDELEDEGKAMRRWLSMFENDYDVADFTITQHLDRLQGSIQIHQGTADDAVPITWNNEFVEKLKLENKKRVEATSAAELSPIEINYFKYPGANHNLQPGWNTAMQRDLIFFKTNH